jgi:hypothetical protein
VSKREYYQYPSSEIIRQQNRLMAALTSSQKLRNLLYTVLAFFIYFFEIYYVTAAGRTFPAIIRISRILSSNQSARRMSFREVLVAEL